MLYTELAELRAQIESIKQRDHSLGQALQTIADHLSQAFGLETSVPAESAEKAESTTPNSQANQAEEAAKQTKTGG